MIRKTFRFRRSAFCVPLIAFCFLLLTSHAQIAPPYYTSADIYAQLKKLNVLGSVLYVAAHPDDENNGFLPYLAKTKLYRTAYLSLTRGDGGQNLIGPEQGIELGMIRTQELLAARKIDGAEQYFTSAYEFGYSRNAAEALRIWNKEQVLADAVWVIRRYQPDIIIARFPPDARAGHGHHAASAIIANEAFTAAADPNRFPEQIKLGVKPWQAKRILLNGFNFGGQGVTGPLRIDVGGFDPLLGKSSGELGGEARSMHKSQGEGRPRRRGEIIENFLTTGGDTARTDIMEGIVTDWSRMDGGKEIQSMIDGIIREYNFEHPEHSVGKLVELYKKLQGGPLMLKANENVWWRRKLDDIRDLIINCSGLFAEATTRDEFVLQNDTAYVNVSVNKRNDLPVNLKQVILMGNAQQPNVPLRPDQQMQTNRNYSFDMKQKITEPAVAQATQPYWLQKPQTPGNFTIADQRLVGNAWNNALLHVLFQFEINGTNFMISRPVQYKIVDLVKGEVYQPFVMIPHLSVSVSPHIALLNVKTERGAFSSDSIYVKYKSNFTGKDVPTTLYILQDTVKTAFEKQPRDFEKGKSYTIALPRNKYYNPTMGENIEAAIRIYVSSSVVTPLGDSATAPATIKTTTENYVASQYFKSIQYDHIPNIHYAFKDRMKFIAEEVKTVGKKIGYISGAGDKIPEALTEMGFEVTVLAESDITDAGLKPFDAIVIGVRAHNIYEYLSDKNDVFNNYVKNGGNLIAQYIKANTIGTKRVKLGPYPFSITTGSRVTEEEAKVSFLLPGHPVLNYPNKITEKDFDGWIQERSTYQADQRDPAFQAPLGMNDTNEKPGDGSLITSRYGKGTFTYVSLVLFRQLPAGVPGAYRLLANIIALSKNK
jgi:LmbE family N-acetylglucosaminyl deacetylase